jgi:solute carrier family 8 (sodium/calcium exchanger)
MEKEGFTRGITFFEENELEISLLATDRHKQIGKWVRENMFDTAHRYDFWHVAKGIMTLLKGQF